MSSVFLCASFYPLTIERNQLTSSVKEIFALFVKSWQKALRLSQIAGIISNVGEIYSPHPAAVLPLPGSMFGEIDSE
jgi:hypothetical protein